MNIWIVQIGEPTPTEFLDNERLMRSGLLARSLAERGHKVTWWATTFDHARKEYRYKHHTIYNWLPGVTIRFLHSPTPYRKNLSLSRIVNHREVARDFRKTLNTQERPDVILCGMPIPELCVEVVRFGKRESIPTYLDIRDLWPDDMIRLIPWWARWATRWLLYPIEKQVTEACQKASGICATSPIFVDWGLRHASRVKREEDADFPLGYSDYEPSDYEQEQAVSYWKKHGITEQSEDFVICFFGALGATCLLKPAIDAVRSLKKEGRKVRLVICGKGDHYEDFRKYASGAENVMFTGWVARPEIWTLMRFADVGLVPVFNIFSYMSNYPNKTIEYMSAGLPLLSSLNGILGQLIKEKNIGVVYEGHDVDNLCGKIKELMDQHSKREEMSCNARILFKQRFAAEKVYAQFSDHLERNLTV